MERTSFSPGRRRLVSAAVWLGIVLLAGSAAVAWLTVNSRADGPTTPGAPPSRAERRPVAVAYVDVEGGVAQLYPVKPGRVTAVPAVEGAPVKASDPLIRIDDTLAAAQVAEAKIARAVAQGQLRTAKRLQEQHQATVRAQRAAVAAARHEVAKAKAAARGKGRFAKEKMGVSPEEAEAARAEVSKAEAAVRGQEARLEALELADPQAPVRLAELDIQAKRKQVEKAEYGLKQCTVVAPEDGTVLRCLVRAGEVLGPSPQQPALIFRPNRPLIVRAEVEQEFAAGVREGQKALIVDNATGGGEWRGVVSRVSGWYTQRRSVLHEPLQFNDVRTLEVIIRLPSDGKGLRIGQQVRVTLNGGS